MPLANGTRLGAYEIVALLAARSSTSSGTSTSALRGTSPSTLRGTSPSTLLGASPSTLLGASPSTLLGASPSASLGASPSALLGTGPSTSFGTSTGELYRATDTRLNRAVVIRTLPSDLAADPDRRTRVEHDVRAVARLNHPHISTLHDIGRERPSGPADRPSNDSEPVIDFLVMEHVEGETLAARLSRGALPLPQALEAAAAIADALDKAHAEGIVHRGLTTSNVMLTPGGVKLLDFGVSTSHHGLGDGGEPNLTASPTKTAAALGAITADALRFMAPEQIEGADADARADLFSLGAVLYEMVTGRRAFDGKTRPVLIASVMTADPDPMSAVQPATPAALERLVRRCLAKDPEERWQTAHDLMIQLRWIAGRMAQPIAPAAVQKRVRRDRIVRLSLVAAVLVAALLAAPAYLYVRGEAPLEAFRFQIPVAGLLPADIAISPDGETVALVARPTPQGAASLFVRPVGALTFRRLAAVEAGAQPFWSPDSRSIAFVAGGRLKRVDASGGAAQDIAEAPDFSGGTWSEDGTILFGSPKGLFRVSAQGGTPESVTTIEKTETGHFWPSFLPDGKHYLFLAWSGTASERAIFLGELGAKERTRLMSAESNVAYATPGYLVFHREATLFGQAFDPNTLAVSGDPFRVADGLGFNVGNGRGSFGVSQNGVLLYAKGQGGLAGRGQIPNFPAAVNNWGWVDRTGRRTGSVHEPGNYADMDLSPDGTRMAITRQETGASTADIWVVDMERAGVPRRLTLDADDDLNPVWSPDGRIAFTSFRKGNADIYVIGAADPAGTETPVLESAENEWVEDWSKDGRYIAFRFGAPPFEDIYAVATSGDGKPFPVVQGRFRKDEPQFSYDGKWLAYTSDKTGAFQVYVTSFPAADQEIPISKDGGGQPRWRRDGRELFYRGSTDLGIHAVDLTLGASPKAGVPKRLTTAPSGTETMNPGRHLWSVAPDGQRFLVRYPNSNAPGGGGGVPLAPVTVSQAGGAGGISPIFVDLTIIRHWTATAGGQK